ncbi:hypothetical protein APSETT445_006156 [Aspergillus pseudonomiae]
MLPAQLSQAQRNTLYSPLPNLRTDVNFATKHPSNSRFVLDKRQMLKWPDFEKEMRSYLTKHVGNIGKSTILKSGETFGVGNELGVQARFTQNVCHVIGEMVEELGYKVNFADYQYGRNRRQGQNKRNRTPIRSRRVPDIVVVHSPSHDIRIIGEIKTAWTFRPKKKQPWDEFCC